MPVDQVAVFASIPSHNEVGDGSRWGDNLLFQHPTPTKKSNKTLKWTRISFAFSWGVGDRNNFPLPYPQREAKRDARPSFGQCCPFMPSPLNIAILTGQWGKRGPLLLLSTKSQL